MMHWPFVFLLLAISIYSSSVSAQGVIINTIGIPNGATIVAGNIFLSTVNATVPDSFDYPGHLGSFELMSGPKEATGSVVVDIMTVNEDISVFDCTYMFPKSLPQGQYHFRVNVSNASVSALSDTFEVTAPQFNCLHPPTWTNITSTSDPNYRSLVLTSPQAGDVQSIGINKGGEIDVSWAYRDARNAVNANISQLTFEYVNDKTGEATGSSTPTLEDTVSTIFAFSGTDLSPGAWRIRANYTNTFEKGSPVSYLSEIFYIDGADGNCEGLATSSIGGKGSNGGAGRFKGLEALWPSVMLVAFPFLSLWQFY